LTPKRTITAILVAFFITSSTGCFMLAKPAVEKVKEAVSDEEEDKKH
jgi:hypothetical protein